MSGCNPGDRVFAVYDADESTVRVLGFGVYTGDERPPDWSLTPEERQQVEDAIREAEAAADTTDVRVVYDTAVERGDMTREEAEAEIAQMEEQVRAERERPIGERVDELIAKVHRNPRIVLDGGQVVWAYQLQEWGLEDLWPQFAGRRQIVGAELAPAS